MLKRVKLTPDERLLTLQPVNRYKLIGPGWVWLKPRQHTITKIYIGPKGEALQYKQVRTAENLPLEIFVRLLYRVEPDYFDDALLARLDTLNSGGWSAILGWQTEYVLRMLIAHYAWTELSRQEIKIRLERHLTKTLIDRLKVVGLALINVNLVRVELPQDLQLTLVRAEQDKVEALGRAEVLRYYWKLFGKELLEAMPFIIQWELINTVHKHTPQILLTPSMPGPLNLSSADLPQVGYQLQLPLHLNGD